MKYYLLLSILLYSFIWQTPSTAQTPVSCLGTLPTDGPHANDSINLPRPRLTLVGFHSTTPQTSYSIEDLICRVYGLGGTPVDTDLQQRYIATISTAYQPFDSPERNSVIFSARALEALISFILEQNAINPASIFTDGENHSHAATVTRLQAAVTQNLVQTSGDDVKRTRSLRNAVEGLDYYLALENAYAHPAYNYTSPPPLTQAQVNTLENRIKNALLRAWDIGDAWVRGGAGRVQAGNYPLKLFTSAAYAALGIRPILTHHPIGTSLTAEILNDALESATSRHWQYQSGNGEAYWAEGAFYLNFSLFDVVPFWHTVRANNVLTHPSLGVQSAYAGLGNPFVASWFTAPLHWMADTSTPLGQTPALDDGNLQSISTTGLLRWSSNYGDASIGRKYQTVFNNISAAATVARRHITIEDQNRFTDLAIPKTTQSATPLPNITNSSGTDQQVVLRIPSGGRTHYLLLNGEHGGAIDRGEGHEQPDNMQLLYMVDSTSVLMDSGYDTVPGIKVNSGQQLASAVAALGIGTGTALLTGGTGIVGAAVVTSAIFNGVQSLVNWDRSSYNNYNDHNVLHWTNSPWGIPYPNLDLFGAGINSEHRDIESLTYQDLGNVHVIKANQKLLLALANGQTPIGDYVRTVLFVEGTHPYLIDINSIAHHVTATMPSKTITSYHVPSTLFESNNYVVTNGEFMRWRNVDGDPEHLYTHPMATERQLYNQEGVFRSMFASSDTAEELLDQPVSITRLDISDFLVDPYFTINTILQYRSGTPAHQPRRIWTYDASIPTTRQGWVWQQDADTYDVFISRSASPYYTPTNLSFNLRNIDASYPNINVFLNASSTYGFIRITRTGGVWSGDASYKMDATAQTNLPLTAVIDGPASLDSGATGTWTSNSYGGSPQYTYAWEYRLACPDASAAIKADDKDDDTISKPDDPTPRAPTCGQWSNGGTNDHFSLSVSALYPPTIKLTITDATSTTRTVTKTISVSDSSNPKMASPDADGSRLAQHRAPDTQRSGGDLPTAFSLEDNYPNPFNPVTEIRFALPEDSPVSLIVYDMMGRYVKQLVTGALPAGHHSVSFDASDLPSGTYLYRLEAGTFQQSKTMVLLK